ncbi:MAG: HlyD family type I secretion periplasmic adaptor subunit [Labrys sp. (in: a-proteobacteria)]
MKTDRIPARLADTPVATAIPAASTTPPARPALDGRVATGIAVIVLFFGGLAAWSALLPLSAGAIASGQLVVEGQRRVVQNLEGGIIRSFLVREGDTVREGQPLLRLDDVQTTAVAEQVRSQADALMAEIARLRAERDNADGIPFPSSLLERRATPRVDEAIRGQIRIFEGRRQAHAGDLDIIQRGIEQTRAEIAGYQGQITSYDEQLRLVREETATVADLVERGLGQKPRLLALQREGAGLQGARDALLGQIARAKQVIAEAELRASQLRKNHEAEVAGALREAEARLSAIEERLGAAEDVDSRRVLRAPVAGIVTNMRFFTPGGIVRPGEPILDIVPAGERLVVEARIDPKDIDTVAIGLPAEVHLTAFRQRRVPLILGKVIYVSADIEIDAEARARGQQGGFYRARIELPADQLRLLHDLPPLSPGMPADVIVSAGERTLLEYLLEPLRESLRRAFRES